MPVTIEIHPESNVFVTRYRGVVNEEQFVAAYKSVRTDDGEYSALDEVADMRLLSDFDVSPMVLRDEAERAAGVLQRIGQRVRCAAIAPEDNSFGLSRIYSAQAGYLGHEDVTVCRDQGEAICWIGLPAETEERLLGDVLR